jgi:DNA-directed RNA polymerase subunit RPC12/RpoP
MKYRRRYICPNCGNKGRGGCKDREEPTARCPFCKTWLYLQVQTEDGVYDKPNEPVDRMEYTI